MRSPSFLPRNSKPRGIRRMRWFFTAVALLLVLLLVHGMVSSFHNTRWLYTNATRNNNKENSTQSWYKHANITTTTTNTATTNNKTTNNPLFIANPKQDAFAACLLVMDDNHRLAEWIPYHYLTMPLRHMVILVDEKSTTSPLPILQKWRPCHMSMELWTTANLPLWYRQRYNSNKSTSNNPNNNNKSSTAALQQVQALLHRQGAFYYACAKHLHQHNYSWTTFHDVDEYYVARSVGHDDDDKNSNTTQQQQQTKTNNIMARPGVILETIRQVQSEMAQGLRPMDEHYVGPCITTYRLLFGVNASTPEQIRKDVPMHLIDNPQRFDTLRFRYYSKTPQIGKSLYNVQQFPVHDTSITTCGAHRLLPQHCPHAYHRPGHWIRIHHYLGSWDSYYHARVTDPRRNNPALGQGKSRSRWHIEGAASQGPLDTVRPWIGAFCRLMARAESPSCKVLLSDVGVVVSSNHTARSESGR